MARYEGYGQQHTRAMGGQLETLMLSPQVKKIKMEEAIEWKRAYISLSVSMSVGYRIQNLLVLHSHGVITETRRLPSGRGLIYLFTIQLGLTLSVTPQLHTCSELVQTMHPY